MFALSSISMSRSISACTCDVVVDAVVAVLGTTADVDVGRTESGTDADAGCAWDVLVLVLVLVWGADEE